MKAPIAASRSGPTFAVPSAWMIASQLNAIGFVAIGVTNAISVSAPQMNIWIFSESFHGSIGRVRGVSLRRSARFVVERDGPGLLHTDGELHEAGARIEFAVRPLSLRVMCPK